MVPNHWQKIGLAHNLPFFVVLLLHQFDYAIPAAVFWLCIFSFLTGSALYTQQLFSSLVHGPHPEAGENDRPRGGAQ